MKSRITRSRKSKGNGDCTLLSGPSMVLSDVTSDSILPRDRVT